MAATAPMTGGDSIAVEPIERTSLHDQVVSRVRDLVVDGTLPAGQRSTRCDEAILEAFERDDRHDYFCINQRLYG